MFFFKLSLLCNSKSAKTCDSSSSVSDYRNVSGLRNLVNKANAVEGNVATCKVSIAHPSEIYLKVGEVFKTGESGSCPCIGSVKGKSTAIIVNVAFKVCRN